MPRTGRNRVLGTRIIDTTVGYWKQLDGTTWTKSCGYQLLSGEMYGNWTDVDSRLEIAEAPTEYEICNAIVNPQTLELADIDDVEEEENDERPFTSRPNKGIVGVLSALEKAVQHRADKKGFEQH